LAGLSSPVFLGLMGCGESFCLAVAQLLLSTQNQALFPCFVSAMLSSVTTELAVAALGSLGCIFYCVLNEWGSNIITHLFALALGLSPALEELLLFAWGLAFSLFETILSTPSICFCFCQTMFSFYSN